MQSSLQAELEPLSLESLYLETLCRQPWRLPEEQVFEAELRRGDLLIPKVLWQE
tara:strand:- start:4651 stop:4812 length:162 start_codon:yes stop_codon:yes gene_type:complete